MKIILFFIQNFLSQAVIIIGLVVLIGMVAQNSSWEKIFPSVIKTMIGFSMINIGGTVFRDCIITTTTNDISNFQHENKNY